MKVSNNKINYKKNSFQDNSDLESLVEKYSDQMFRTAYFLCKNNSDAEDIVQEVFIRYMQKKPKFKDENHEKAWLLRTTINLTKDYIKSFWNRKTQGLELDIPYIMEEEKELLDCISRLPNKYRIIIVLYYQEGYKIREIAQILKRKQSTIGSQLNKARELLKKEMEV